MTGPMVATALDLPIGSPGGSVELFLDLYTGPNPLIPAHAFMLQPLVPRPRLPAGLELLPVNGKCLGGPALPTYITQLRRTMATALDPGRIDVLHLQHLAFGATPALIRALPTHPRIALVHGTDLLFAADHRAQLQTLRATARAAHAIVVPTAAMADHLITLAPATDRTKIVNIPWGIPDQLLNSPPPLPTRVHDERLRLLYAGRLTSEKGIAPLIRAVAHTPGAELSIAAPLHQYQQLGPLLQETGLRANYLGWLTRHQLWRVFTEHDALVVPSTTLEAMGLVALEAQACGLPVLYQPVPGLTESLANSALPTDLSDAPSLAHALTRLRASPNHQKELRQAGLRNAARYPLSATATELIALGKQIS